MYARTESELNIAIVEIEKEEKKYKSFVTRFKKNMERRSSWLLLDRLHLITRNHNTNNFSEASVRVLKDIILDRCKAYNPVALVEFVVNVWEPHLEERLTDFAHDRRSSPRIFYDKLCNKMNNFSKADIVLISESIYKVPSSNRKEMYTINTDIGSCSCPSGITGAFCKHMALVHKELNISLPNLPPITLEERHALGILALGDACPPREFFLALQESVQTEVITSNQEESSSGI